MLKKVGEILEIIVAKNCVVLGCGSVRWLKVILTVIYPSTQQGGLVKEDGVLFSADWQF